MRRRTRSARRFKRANKQLIWTTVIEDFTQFDDAAGGTTILLEGLDWNNAGQYTKGAVVERVVGSFSIYPAISNAGSGPDINFHWFCSMVKQDANVTVIPNPKLASGYSEDVLQCWNGGAALFATAVPTLTWERNVGFHHQDVDVRTKRKMTTDDVLYFQYGVESDDAAANMVISFLLRTLVSLP